VTYTGAIEKLGQPPLPAEVEAFVRRTEADPGRHERSLLLLAFHPFPEDALVDRLQIIAPSALEALARSPDPSAVAGEAVRRLAAVGIARRSSDAGFRGRIDREVQLRRDVNAAVRRLPIRRLARYLVDALLTEPRLLWQVGMQLAMNELLRGLAQRVFESEVPETLYAQIGGALRHMAEQRRQRVPIFRRGVERERLRRIRGRERRQQLPPVLPSTGERATLASIVPLGLAQPSPSVREQIIRLGKSGERAQRQRALDLIVATYYRRPRMLHRIVYDPTFRSPPYDVETGFANLGRPQTIRIGPRFFTDFRRRFERRARTIGHELQHVLQRTAGRPIRNRHTREFLAIWWTVTAVIPGLRPLGRAQTLAYISEPNVGAMAQYRRMPEADRRRYRRVYEQLRLLLRRLERRPVRTGR
jgi:hypothetical protein